MLLPRITIRFAVDKGDKVSQSKPANIPPGDCDNLNSVPANLPAGGKLAMDQNDASLHRLLLWQKFVILSLIGLVIAAIPAALYFKQTAEAIDTAQLEIDGQKPAAAIFKVIQLTQQHRGLAALALAGSEEARQKRALKQQETSQAYAQMDTIIHQLNDKGIEDAWRLPKQEWEALSSDIASGRINVVQSYIAHTKLIPELLIVNDLTVDHFGLQLDPHPDAYQLIQAVFYYMPYLAEETGRMRAMGVAMLAKKEASAEERQTLAAIVARVQDRLLQTGTAFNKAAAANPQLRKALGAQWLATEAQTAGMMALANAQIIKAEALSYSSSDYLARTTSAIDAQFAVNTAAAGELEQMLNKQIGNLHRQRAIILGAMLSLIVLAGVAAYLIARSVCRPLIRSERPASPDFCRHA